MNSLSEFLGTFRGILDAMVQANMLESFTFNYSASKHEERGNTVSTMDEAKEIMQKLQSELDKEQNFNYEQPTKSDKNLPYVVEQEIEKRIKNISDEFQSENELKELIHGEIEPTTTNNDVLRELSCENYSFLSCNQEERRPSGNLFDYQTYSNSFEFDANNLEITEDINRILTTPNAEEIPFPMTNNDLMGFPKSTNQEGNNVSSFEETINFLSNSQHLLSNPDYHLPDQNCSNFYNFVQDYESNDHSLENSTNSTIWNTENIPTWTPPPPSENQSNSFFDASNNFNLISDLFKDNSDTNWNEHYQMDNFLEDGNSKTTENEPPWNVDSISNFLHSELRTNFEEYSPHNGENRILNSEDWSWNSSAPDTFREKDRFLNERRNSGKIHDYEFYSQNHLNEPTSHVFTNEHFPGHSNEPYNEQGTNISGNFDINKNPAYPIKSRITDSKFPSHDVLTDFEGRNQEFLNTNETLTTNDIDIDKVLSDNERVINSSESFLTSSSRSQKLISEEIEQNRNTKSKNVINATTRTNVNIHQFNQNLVIPQNIITTINNEICKTMRPLKEISNSGVNDTFRCTECGELYFAQKNLLIHLARKHKIKKEEHKCTICDKIFSRSSTLKAHLNIHASSKPFKCTQCDQEFAQKVSLNIHVQQQHSDGNKLYQCNRCDRSFTTSSRLKFHEKCHENPEYLCSICGKKFSTSQYLISHQRIHEKLYGCGKCDEKFNDKELLRKHGLKAHQSFPCHIGSCNRIYKSRRALKMHVFNKHTGQSISCDVCGVRLSDKSVLKRHKRYMHFVHGRIFQTKPKERRHFCSICGNGFYKRYVLKEHLKIHSDRREFVCEICGKAFVNNTNLKVHKKIHNNDESKSKWSFKCSKCGISITSRCGLRYHMKMHQPEEKRLACRTCGKTFVRLCHYKIHLLKHTTDRPFKCKHCWRSYKYAPHLRVHEVRFHPSNLSISSIVDSILVDDNNQKLGKDD